MQKEMDTDDRLKEGGGENKSNSNFEGQREGDRRSSHMFLETEEGQVKVKSRRYFGTVGSEALRCHMCVPDFIQNLELCLFWFILEASK